MRSILTAIVVGFTGLGVGVSEGAVSAWFNEFHYDNVSNDTGEFIEIAVQSDFTDLANLVVTLYNGTGGTPYGTHALDTFAVGASPAGYTLYSKLITGLQNEAEGFSLSHLGVVIQALSYEGSFTGVGGPADGVSLVDIGVVESGTTPIGSSLGLTGSGSSYADFSWVVFSAGETPGALNSGQIIVPIPEPAEWGLICAVGLLGVCGLHTWRERRRALRGSPSAR